MNSTLVARQIPEYCATLIAAVLSQDLNPLETPELKKLWAQKKRDSLTFSSLKKTDVLYIHVHPENKAKHLNKKKNILFVTFTKHRKPDLWKPVLLF